MTRVRLILKTHTVTQCHPDSQYPMAWEQSQPTGSQEEQSQPTESQEARNFSPDLHLSGYRESVINKACIIAHLKRIRRAPVPTCPKFAPQMHLSSDSMAQHFVCFLIHVTSTGFFCCHFNDEYDTRWVKFRPIKVRQLLQSSTSKIMVCSRLSWLTG